MKGFRCGVSSLAVSLVLVAAMDAAAGEEPSVSDKARAEGFEDRVEAERENHVRKAVDAAEKRATPATPTPEATPTR